MSVTMRTAAMLFLAAPPGGSEAKLTEALGRERERLNEALVTAGEARLAVRMPDAELAELWRRTAHLRLEDAAGDGGAYRVEDYPPAPFAAALLLTGRPGDFPELLAPLTGIAGRLGGLLDPAASAAVAGTEEIVIPGEAAFAYLNNVRRRRGQSLEDFHSYWRLEHTKLSTRIPAFRGYRQVHSVGVASEELGTAAGLSLTDFDGLVEGYADSIDDMVTQWTWEVENKLYEDEAMFTDIERCVMGYYRLTS